MKFLFPITMIALDLGAAVVCFFSRDYKKAIYWIAAAVLNAAIDRLVEAARFRIKRKPVPEPEFCYGNGCCPNCRVYFIDKSTHYCGNCGQALDWGGV